MKTLQGGLVMQKILEKSNELGLMISRTDAAQDFHKMESLVASDADASLLLKNYNEFAEMIRLKHESGFEIESYEADEFSQMTESVSSNRLLREYIRSRNKYMDMLVIINNALSI